MAYKNVLYSIRDAVAIITINRPDKLNALNWETLEELSTVIDNAYTDIQVRAVVLTGSGEKAFAAGADIKELQALSMSEAMELSRFGQKLFLRIETFPKPFIALVNGFALGGGCELAMACHFRYASENARFGQPEVNLGLVPGYGGTQRLTRLVGRGRALELLLSGESVPAQRAYEMGLVNKIFPQAELMNAGINAFQNILEKSPLAQRYCIEAVHHGLNASQETGMDIEAAYFGMAFASEDMHEGTSAFLEKRSPKFKGQ